MNKVIDYCLDYLDFDAVIDGYISAVAVLRHCLDTIDIGIDSSSIDVVTAIVNVAVAVDNDGVGVVSTAVVHFDVSRASHASHYLF